ncbi:MAG TPA: ectoine/hydroxyectoine ABC transporter permease subunit EhuC [Firmicutes bacterium]|jgi:polar amino acid transport system permease protein|nr:ectoine/hydroxyectoine ABC transporter permease subunit EhuC [Bacillota bacterium]HAW71737.1 ectoine/hydroxyectoine ABC transporter permease subunit EhuC [Bacillota bacterium]HAZ21713.1 ectoine/hydroxyectoine ABC transporter permease subunit EhuC [Bacillota bacterium]HBE06642.1 ectoine/hydroxyectoine ABC transporter permease subunit EhuC [Bacillota bacterium]HBG45159.1 ectoine/hydroxyectoine ABC transporter permease subunit EhuC [Bacillota bacterium]
MLWSNFPYLLKGAVVSLQVTVFSIIFGIILGLFVALGRLSGARIIRFVCAAFVEFIRGTPLLVQIYIVYFALPQLGVQLDPIPAGVLAIGINSGAYNSEIFRGGIQSIDKGQTEAARSQGMTYWQTMRYVILPQALRRIIPPLGNEFVTLIKDSSLVSIMSVHELTFRAKLVAARTYNYFTMYIGTAIIYFIMTFITSKLLGLLERRLRISD